MGIAFEELARLVGQDGKWKGFEACSFTPERFSVEAVLGCRNAWSCGKETIRDYVKRIGAANLPDAVRIKSYADAFQSGPVTLVGFRMSTLRRIWASQYGNLPGDDLVIWDGHHRTSALAIREVNCEKDANEVTVYVGS